MENPQRKLQLVLSNWRGHGVDVTLLGGDAFDAEYMQWR